MENNNGASQFNSELDEFVQCIEDELLNTKTFNLDLEKEITNLKNEEQITLNFIRKTKLKNLLK